MEVIRPVRVMALMPPHAFSRQVVPLFSWYPTGESEVLLNVPQYRFHWQTTYYLAQPKILPVEPLQRWMPCSTTQPTTPDTLDPQATVKQGLQSWRR